ncbi:hypothetical protein B0J14DRAFT_94316 [Halenospora varia]|nr:hypothetical protein B0J14DRAFT_94316 [Halenospora varia]
MPFPSFSENASLFFIQLTRPQFFYWHLPSDFTHFLASGCLAFYHLITDRNRFYFLRGRKSLLCHTSRFSLRHFRSSSSFYLFQRLSIVNRRYDTCHPYSNPSTLPSPPTTTHHHSIRLQQAQGKPRSVTCRSQAPNPSRTLRMSLGHGMVGRQCRHECRHGKGDCLFGSRLFLLASGARLPGACQSWEKPGGLRPPHSV